MDLAQVRASLEAAGIRVLDARVLLVASLPPEVTITRSGRILFKTGDPAVAQRAFEQLLAVPAISDAPVASLRRSIR